MAANGKCFIDIAPSRLILAGFELKLLLIGYYVSELIYP
jgi:hypothetical protein